jgi:hypothetical protein
LGASAAIATEFDGMIEQINRCGGGSALTRSGENGFDGLCGSTVAAIGSEDGDNFQRQFPVSSFQMNARARPRAFSNQKSHTEALGDWFSAEAVGLRYGSDEDVFVYEAASCVERLLVEVE